MNSPTQCVVPTPIPWVIIQEALEVRREYEGQILALVSPFSFIYLSIYWSNLSKEYYCFLQTMAHVGLKLFDLDCQEVLTDPKRYL